MMYLDYRKEREGIESVQNEYGFIAYKIHNQNCHIYDAYVCREKRRSNIATELADEVVKIAREAGCLTVTACVVPSLNGATESMLAQLSYGFRITSAMQDCIFLTKEI